MTKITKQLTKYNFSDKNDTKRIKYIVVHYFGGLSSAKNLAAYWASKYVGASAHYIVGHAGEIYQSVEDGDVAWHCGAKSYKHPACRNSNSIGIEMAVRKKNAASLKADDQDWYFETATVDATVELVKDLMEKYHVPVENVLRHYDVTGKSCPNPYMIDKKAEKAWKAFKNRLSAKKAEPEKTGGVKEYDIPLMTGQIEPYQIKTTCNILNIRKAPDVESQKVGTIAEDGLVIQKKKYTIVEERDGWGRLKSGAGWICLEHTKKIS